MRHTVDTSKLLVDTQHRLAVCTDEILSQEYGTGWELVKNMVFDEQTQRRLQERRNSRNGKITRGSKLVEFCDFLDLRNIFTEHSGLFFNVFPMWEKTLEIIDRLARFDVQKNRGYELDTNSYQECVKGCAYILKSLEEWEHQSKVQVSFYYCDVSFDEVEGNDLPGAKSKALKQARKWFEQVTGGCKVVAEPSAELGTVYVLKENAGTVKISDPFVNRVYSTNGYLVSARVRVMAEIFPIFADVLSKSNRSYSNICWVINSANLGTLIRYADSVRGIEPYEEPNDFAQSFTSWGGQEYYLLKNGKTSVRMSLSGIKDGLLRIKLVKDNSEFDNGFVSAHSNFSPQTLYAILLGIVSPTNVKSVIEDSIKSTSNDSGIKERA